MVKVIFHLRWSDIFAKSKVLLQTSFAVILYLFHLSRRRRIPLPKGQYNLRSKYHLFRKEQIQLKKALPKKCFFHGAADRGRTDTVSLPLDFESSASANSTTAANHITALVYHICFKKSSIFFIF